MSEGLQRLRDAQCIGELLQRDCEKYQGFLLKIMNHGKDKSYEIGIRQFCTFDHMTTVFHDIEE